MEVSKTPSKSAIIASKQIQLYSDFVAFYFNLLVKESDWYLIFKKSIIKKLNNRWTH